MKTLNIISIVIIAGFTFSSCVSSKKFKGVSENLNQAQTENNELRKNKTELEIANKELFAKNSQLEQNLATTQKQLEEAKYSVSVLRQQTSGLEKEIEKINNQMDALKSGSSAEIEKLLTQLNLTRTDLNQREDKLRAAEKELEARNKRLVELQEILTQKDEAVKALKSKVMSALTGFTNNGLTVHEKNGKVYVSLDEKLMFKTGKWEVDPNGQKALKELGNVLAQNPDINIMVEGHTDDVPMRGSGDVKDNWDLSVMRATAVTKILMQNKLIDPIRIVAAGRSEFLPLSEEKTAAARQQNRRTEIILTPKIDELLRLIENN